MIIKEKKENEHVGERRKVVKLGVGSQPSSSKVHIQSIVWL